MAAEVNTDVKSGDLRLWKLDDKNLIQFERFLQNNKGKDAAGKEMKMNENAEMKDASEDEKKKQEKVDEEIEVNQNVEFPGIQLAQFDKRAIEHSPVTFGRNEVLIVEQASCGVSTATPGGNTPTSRFFFLYDKSNRTLERCDECRKLKIIRTQCQCGRAKYCSERCRDDDEEYRSENCCATSSVA